MKRVRWLALVAVVALVAAACGDDGADPTTTDAGAPTTAEPGTTTPPDPDFEGLVLDSGGCDYGGQINTIEATAESEVVFTLCGPDPAFLAKIAFVPFAAQSADHLEATGGAPIDDAVGTGPFKLVEWDRGNQVILERNDDYWGDAPAFQTLVFQWRENSTQRIDLLTTGQADFATNLAESDYAIVEANPDLVLLPDENPNIFYVGFNNQYEPFDNPDVRRAIAMGIDRQRIVDTFYPAGSEVPSHFTPCSIALACEGDDWYDFDLEAARDLLAEAGYPNGFDTTIFYRDVFRVYLPEPPTVAQEIQTQLRENLGINATIEQQESGAFLAINANTNCPGQPGYDPDADESCGHDGIHLLGWGADYPHVTNFLDFHFGGGNLQFGDPIPEVVALLAEGAQTADEAAAAPIYEEANNLIRDLVPMIPMVHGAAADVALATVQNPNVPPNGAPQFALMDPGDDDLVFVQNAEPLSLYCSDETDGETLSICEQMFEGLYGYAVDGAVIPKLATGCEPNEDGTVWTCTLRSGVTFHDGSTFDANDVVATWMAGLDAANPLHAGNTGAFEYYSYLWGNLINN